MEPKKTYDLSDAEANTIWLALLAFGAVRAEELGEARFEALVSLFEEAEGGSTEQEEVQ